MPDSLPEFIEWDTGSRIDGVPVLRYSLPRRKPQGKGGNGATDVAVVNPYVPFGAVAWRVPSEGIWRPVSELPAEWGPWLPNHNQMQPCQ